MVVPGQGLWRSTDQGSTFERVDRGTISGRCETAFSLQVDPAGGRLACFMLDGTCGMTSDGGKTWTPFTGLGRNWDYAAVDWTGERVRHIFGARHETGGEVFLSHDAGKSTKPARSLMVAVSLYCLDALFAMGRMRKYAGALMSNPSKRTGGKTRNTTAA